MSGYLEQYGEGEDRKEHLIRNGIALALAAIALGALTIYLFRPFHQISVTKHFLNLLRNRDYAGAYTAWGCGSSKPCPEYTYEKFLEDWGPKSAVASDSALRITDAESCGAGVILNLAGTPGSRQTVYVGKDSDSLSFSPLTACPGKSAWAIMTHRTLGRLRQVFF